jgi:hypothetical protein
MIMAMQPFDFLRAMRMPVIGMVMTSMIMIAIMAFMGMVMMLVLMLMRMVMIVIMMCVIMTTLRLLSGRLALERSNGITEAGYLLLDRLQVAASVMTHGHRTCRHRDGDIFDPVHAPDGRVDFRRASGAIHAANPVPCLCCFTHDLNPCL